MIDNHDRYRVRNSLVTDFTKEVRVTRSDLEYYSDAFSKSELKRLRHILREMKRFAKRIEANT